MGLFGGKQQQTISSIERARNELMAKLGNKYQIPGTMIVKNSQTGVKTSMTILIIASKDPLVFNPTLLPSDAEYVVFEFLSDDGMQKETLGLIGLEEFLGMLRNVSRQTHELGEFGMIEYFEIQAQYPGLTLEQLQVKLKQLKEL